MLYIADSSEEQSVQFCPQNTTERGDYSWELPDAWLCPRDNCVVLFISAAWVEPAVCQNVSGL
jgi:hypothetical protein